jgi:predicted nucleic acid-binding protein
VSTDRVALYVAEPSAKYLNPPPLVVDCSTLAGLLFQEEWQELAAARIAGRSLHAPFLLHLEIASVAVKKYRQGQQELATLGMAEFDNMNIKCHETDRMGAFDLAIRYQLSVYDAAYLWLAAELKAPLATFDGKLGRAAQSHLSSL